MESEEVLVQVVGDKLILRPLKPKVVGIDPAPIEKLLHGEHNLESNLI